MPFVTRVVRKQEGGADNRMTEEEDASLGEVGNSINRAEKPCKVRMQRKTLGQASSG